MVGKIERVPLRDIWKHEAYDFTSWLQDNIDVLNDVLGLSLSNPEREQSAGSFNVDLVEEDENGNPVIIENQLEKSDHNHLRNDTATTEIYSLPLHLALPIFFVSLSPLFPDQKLWV